MNTITRSLTALALLAGPMMANASTVVVDSISERLRVAEYYGSSRTPTATDRTILRGLSADGSASLPYTTPPNTPPIIPGEADISLSYSLDAATGVFSAGGTTFGCGPGSGGFGYKYKCNGRIDLTFTTSGPITYTLQEPVRVFNEINGIPGGTSYDGCGLAVCSYTLGAGTYTLDLRTDLPYFDGLGTVLTFATPVSVGAPEIDPSSAVSGLALLVGSLLVLRGRRTPL
jgi:hypothetical protein